jgi:hypothetical protein
MFDEEAFKGLGKSKSMGPGNPERPETIKDILLLLLKMGLVIGAFIAILQSLEHFGTMYISQLSSTLPHLYGSLLFTLFLFVVGFSLYMFKFYKMYRYGQAAIAFGLLSGWRIIFTWQTDTGNPLVKGIALAGALYVLVRGFEDMDKSRGVVPVTQKALVEVTPDPSRVV